MTKIEIGGKKRDEESNINNIMTIKKGGQGDFAAVHPSVWNGRA
jgi:hypothetical protein